MLLIKLIREWFAVVIIVSAIKAYLFFANGHRRRESPLRFTYIFYTLVTLSFWAGGVLQLQQTSLISQLDRFLEPSNHNRSQIWIDWGCQRLNGFHNLLFESQAARLGKSMVNLLQQKYNYVLGKDLFKYEDLIGGHDERAWAYRFGLLLKQYYKLDN